MNFRQHYGGAPHFRQPYGFSARTGGTGGWAANQQIVRTQTARIWVQDGKIMGFVTMFFLLFFCCCLSLVRACPFKRGTSEATGQPSAIRVPARTYGLPRFYP